MTTLDYSTSPAPKARSVIGHLAACFNAIWSAGLTVWLIGEAQDYFIWDQSVCGTPAARLEQQFFFFSPFMIGVPLAGWLMAQRARSAQRWARIGLTASITAWATTAAFIKWGWMLR